MRKRMQFRRLPEGDRHMRAEGREAREKFEKVFWEAFRSDGVADTEEISIVPPRSDPGRGQSG